MIARRIVPNIRTEAGFEQRRVTLKTPRERSLPSRDALDMFFTVSSASCRPCFRMFENCAAVVPDADRFG